MHKRYLPLKLKSIETEGFSYFPRQEILIHDVITMLNGENGAGKTTLLNMFRVLFGAKKFDNGHTLKTFFERDHIHEIYILGKFSNTIDQNCGRRPFQEIGKWNDDVTIVCRLINDKQISREYIIFDGVFDLEKNLNEKINWLDVGQYLHQMSEIGMPRSLSNAFSLSQGKTEKILELSEEQLAQYILQICGEQERIEQFNKIKIDLKEQKEQFHKLCLQKQQEELTLDNLLKKITRFKEIKQHEETKNILSFNKPLSILKTLNGEINIINSSLKQLDESIKTLDLNLLEKQKQYDVTLIEKDNIQAQLNKITTEINDLQTEITPIHINLNEISTQISNIEEFIIKYENIEEVDLQLLQTKKNKYTIQHRNQITKVTNVLNEIELIKSDISKIEKNKNVIYPLAVQKLTELLESEEIQYLLLAEYVEMQDHEWRNAIEALLGNERFTIIVDPKQIVSVMKIAQQIEYPFWISPYSSCVLNADKQSILTKMTVLDERISGYLNKYSKYKMAATIEEAWEWSSKGDSCILNKPYPYLVTKRGGKSIKANRLYCGKKAYEAQLIEYYSQLNKLETNIIDLKAEEEILSNKLKIIDAQINDQENRLLLPEKQTIFFELLTNKTKLKQKLIEYTKELSQKKSNQHMLIINSQNIFAEIAKLEEQLNQSKHSLKAKVSQQNDLSTKKEIKKRNFQQIYQQLSKEQQHKFRDEEYCNSLSEYEFYKTEIEKINSLIQQLYSLGDPLDPEIENLVVLEEKYKAHSVLLQNNLNEIENTENQLEKLQQKHAEAREEFMTMVQEAFKRVKLSLETMAKEGNIQATINFFPYGDEKWRADYKIGFHGKKPISYRSNSKLSGGQKVVASLLLTLATIKADGILSFMILDEPFAHLDQQNMELVGSFLKNTNSQYIIAMPYSENLKVAYPFVDMSIQLRPKEPNEEVAPPITYGVINDEYIQQKSHFKPQS
ncbi:AAA family ATPase [Calidifontibacillus oryziterrae]|uniref:AAA family ATPase n=1 Tax=Calidifontibacillus oryziterrae TaxID=1191699 RepID=UPI00137573F0|nr:AAA family ATPase [Calidifontibacillus oryziterrae]